MGNFKFNKRLFIVMTLLALLLAGIASFSNSYNSTNAFGACSAVGSFTQSNSISNKSAGVANPDAGNRKWTVNEVFSGSVGYSSFYGEGPSTWLYAEKEQRGKDKPGWTDDTQKAIESARSGMCVVGGADGIPYTFTLIANGLTWLTGVTVMTLIGKDLMAETLTKIVGGGGEGEGLIGVFLSSFYMPLVVIAGVIMAVTLIYKGLIQMKLRESFGALLWSIGAFVVGVAFMLNPQLLASAPQKATSTITSCVIGALSGQNCLSGKVEAPSMLAGKECVSNIGGEGNSAENVTNSLNCTIWKAFVLEPWAEEQFGVPYNQLYTKSPPDGEETWKNISKDEKPDKYCVNLSSSKSFSESTKSGAPVMDGSNGTVCNVALYHLFVKTKMIDTVNQKGNNYNDKNVIVEDENGYSYDSRWYDIIVPMANDDSKWRNYSGNGMFFSRLGTSIMGLIAIIASSTVLLTLAIFGGAYKVVGLILMAFAPIFLLFAIEPTRGRKIFLGWLETLISSILKYFAITVLIVIALVMYAGLLSNTTGVASLVGTIVLTLALHMYRKEIVDLIGASNMGGQRLSNKVNEMGSKAGKFAKDKGGAMIGGAVGGMIGSNLARNDRVNARNKTISDLQNKIASASNQTEKDFYEDELKREEEAKNAEGTALGTTLKGGLSGSNDSFKRSFKRGNGLAARAFQQSDRTREDLRRQDAKEQNKADDRIAEFENQSDIGRRIDNVDIEKSSKEIKRDISLNEVRDTQRENVDYEGKLSGDEINALDNFAHKLANSASDEDLAFAANNPAVLEDPNRRNLVANEINARIRANSMVGISSDILSRTNLTDRNFVSDDELALNVQMHKENFLESGSQAELDKYLATQTEIARRNGNEFNSEADRETLMNYKNQVGDAYERNIHIPTEEELKKLDDYSVKLPKGEFNSKSVVTPISLNEEMKNNKDKVNEVKDLDEQIKIDKSKRSESINEMDNNKNNSLPNIDDIDNDSNGNDDDDTPGGNGSSPKGPNNNPQGDDGNSTPNDAPNDGPKKPRDKDSQERTPKDPSDVNSQQESPKDNGTQNKDPFGEQNRNTKQNVPKDPPSRETQERRSNTKDPFESEPKETSNSNENSRPESRDERKRSDENSHSEPMDERKRSNENFNFEKRQRPEVDNRFNSEDFSNDPFESLSRDMDELDAIEDSLNDLEDLSPQMQVLKHMDNIILNDDDKDDK